MKILYGVQGTGQGHLSRAYAMAKALSTYPVEVTWLVSGREKHQLFDMQPFGDYLHRRGLSFATDNGKIRYRKTLARNSVRGFLREAGQLEVSSFDLVITDFEPVTAWAAKLAGAPSIAIGHQYAFGRNTPQQGLNPFKKAVMKSFAPAQTSIGLHWYPYSDTILPPIVHLPDIPTANDGHIVVYLPFENQAAVTDMLQRCPDHRFLQFASTLENGIAGNVQLCKASTQRFKHELASAAGVICNCGFELLSECMQWGKPVLTKPLGGQPEQLSNAYALELLGSAIVTPNLSSGVVSRWLKKPLHQQSAGYPDVAKALSMWIATGCAEQPEQLSTRLWSLTGPKREQQRRMPMVSAPLAF